MNCLLEALRNSINHLQVLDDIMGNHNSPDTKIYSFLRENIKKLDSSLEYNKLSEELYVGGKKRNVHKKTKFGDQTIGYGRQMILSDIMQYIINGRGYFFALRSQKAMEVYIEILLNILNQLMILDSCVVDVALRHKILKSLGEKIGIDTLCKDNDEKNKYKALLLYDGHIGFPAVKQKVSSDVCALLGLKETEQKKALNILDECYDSFFPKPVGLWGEILVYLYLIRMNVGYIFPLLLTQRLITGRADVFLKPPDFLILPFGKAQFYGIEVGAGKDIQSGNFSITTGLPTATKANANNPKRCCICGKWMLFCPLVISRYKDTSFPIKDINKPIKCVADDGGCTLFTKAQILDGSCSYAMHQGGKPSNTVMIMQTENYHFHYNCMKQDPQGSSQIKESKIVAHYPYVSGLEEFENMVCDKQLVQKQIEQLKSLIAEINKTEPKKETESK